MLKYYFKSVKHLSIQGTTKIQIEKSGTATDFYQVKASMLSSLEGSWQSDIHYLAD